MFLLGRRECSEFIYSGFNKEEGVFADWIKSFANRNQTVEFVVNLPIPFDVLTNPLIDLKNMIEN
jgi:hypothetical protein